MVWCQLKGIVRVMHKGSLHPHSLEGLGTGSKPLPSRERGLEHPTYADLEALRLRSERVGYPTPDSSRGIGKTICEGH